MAREAEAKAAKEEALRQKKEEAARKAAEKEAKAKVPPSEMFRGGEFAGQFKVRRDGPSARRHILCTRFADVGRVLECSRT